MNISYHGLTLGIERIDGNYFVSIKASGKLTHEDYETITPMIDSALNVVKVPKLKALFDISDLEGWELRAAWDDLKLGLKHRSQFEKIAIYGTKRWQEAGAKIGAWFVSGEVQYFENKEDAIAWLKQ